MVNAVLSSKDHSGQVAELQYRIVKQTKMIGLVGNIIKAYDDKDAEAADDSAYIHAVDEALDYLRSINHEDALGYVVCLHVERVPLLPGSYAADGSSRRVGAGRG